MFKKKIYLVAYVEYEKTCGFEARFVEFGIFKNKTIEIAKCIKEIYELVSKHGGTITNIQTF